MFYSLVGLIMVSFSITFPLTKSIFYFHDGLLSSLYPPLLYERKQTINHFLWAQKDCKWEDLREDNRRIMERRLRNTMSYKSIHIATKGSYLVNLFFHWFFSFLLSLITFSLWLGVCHFLELVMDIAIDQLITQFTLK